MPSKGIVCPCVHHKDARRSFCNQLCTKDDCQALFCQVNTAKFIHSSLPSGYQCHNTSKSAKLCQVELPSQSAIELPSSNKSICQVNLSSWIFQVVSSKSVPSWTCQVKLPSETCQVEFPSGPSLPHKNAHTHTHVAGTSILEAAKLIQKINLAGLPFVEWPLATPQAPQLHSKKKQL